jgi:hypothetical protein
MTKRRVRAYQGAGAMLAALAGAASSFMLTHCASDDRADKPVVVTTDCNLAALEARPGSSGTAIRTYVEATDGVLAGLTDVRNQLMAVCQKMDAELGEPTGNDVRTACQPINRRGTTALKSLPPSPQVPAWYNVIAPDACQTDPTAEATCLTTCSGPCDVSKCAGGAQGVCAGTCKGVCAKLGNVACNGACMGTCKNSANTCTGECQGACDDIAFMGGRCDEGCGAIAMFPDPMLGPFFGSCKGTCTGSCDGKPANGGFPPPPDPDAGADAEAPIPPDLSAAPGNCASGYCVGICDKDSSGQCFTGCAGKFSEGMCQGTCTGDCVAGLGTGCVSTSTADPDGGTPATCDGICVEPTAPEGSACEGFCQGECSQPMTDIQCTGALGCGQNTECSLACQAKAALSAQCAPPAVVEVESVTDRELYAVLKKYGPELSMILQRLAFLRTAEAAIASRTVPNFEAVGPLRDLERVCIAKGQKTATDAHKVLLDVAPADPTIPNQALAQ